MAVIIKSVNSDETIKQADAEFASRKKLIGDYTNYYNGEHRKQLVKSADDVVYNVCKQVVDETVSFLLPEMPTIELDNDIENDAELYLRKVWNDSGGVTLLSRMATIGGITGHVFARVKYAGVGTPKITVIPSVNVIKYTSADDAEMTTGYELRWSNDRQTIVLQENGTWLITEYTMAKNGRAWVQVGDAIEWGYSLPPIVDWQHLPAVASPYGVCEIPHYKMNDNINKIASDVQSILRYHAYPVTVGTGFKADEELIQTGVDSFTNIPNPDAKVYNLEMSSDLKSSMNMLNDLTERFFAQSRVVIHKGIDNFRGMTNLGVRASYMPMIAKNETLRRQYSEGIATICSLLLEIEGYDSIGTTVSVEWGEALPVDSREQFELVKAQMGLGIMSPQTGSERLKLDWKREQERIDEAKKSRQIVGTSATEQPV